MRSWLVLCLGLAFPALAWGNASTACDQAMTGGKFVQAASCFLALANKMKPGNQLSKLERKRKALYLNKAAFAYRRAARLSKTDASRSFLYERALKQLDRILQEKLCLKAFRCRLIAGQRAEIARSVGYARLTLVVQRKTDVTVTLQGHHHNENFTLHKTVTRSLRPGRYTVTYQEAGKQPVSQAITLKPNETQALTVAALVVVKTVPRAPASRRGAWTLIGVGIAASVTSAVLLGVGYAFQMRAVTLAQEQNELRTEAGLVKKHRQLMQKNKLSSTRELLQSNQFADTLESWSEAGTEINSKSTTGNILVVTGWPTAGVGIAAVVAGSVWLATLSGSSSPPPPPRSRSTSSTRMSPLSSPLLLLWRN